jgi:hypothetical protein
LCWNHLNISSDWSVTSCNNNALKANLDIYGTRIGLFLAGTAEVRTSQKLKNVPAGLFGSY